MKNVTCPICKSTGYVEITDGFDFVSAMSGSWTYCRCSVCMSLWQHPLPSFKQLLNFYPPVYYTHEKIINSLFAPENRLSFASFRVSFKKYILANHFGYVSLSENISTFRRLLYQTFVKLKPNVLDWAGEKVRFLHFKKNGHLLDVGCGNGDFLYQMKGLGWKVMGLEMDAKAVQFARSAGIDVFESTIDNFPINEFSFDAVVMSHVAEHLIDPKNDLLRLLNLLNTGGTLVSVSPNPSSFLCRIFKKYWRGLEPPRHIVFLSQLGYKNIFSLPCLDIRTFTTNSRITSWFRDGITLRRRKLLNSKSSWLLPKIFARIFLHIFNVLFSGKGEEVVCVVRRTSAK